MQYPNTYIIHDKSKEGLSVGNAVITKMKMFNAMNGKPKNAQFVNQWDRNHTLTPVQATTTNTNIESIQPTTK